MFNTNRGLFPAYSGLGDIEVALPSPPSRSSIARDVEDLWSIHTSEPHITAASDPGIGVPYPDNGYDPSSLSEDSEVSVLINRASDPLTSEQRDELLAKLNEQYTDRLVTNLQMSGMAAGSIKESMLEQCPGSLLVYNGNDRDSLIKAFTLCKALEYIVETFVKGSVFTEDAKAEMLSFISPCPAIRDALVLPEHIVRQRLFGSTESRDSIDHALSIFGLSDDERAAKENPLNEGFEDYQEKIDFAELECNRAVLHDILHGDAHKAMDHALRQVLPHLNSDISEKLTSAVVLVRRKAGFESKKTARALITMMSGLKSDLEKVGVDPRTIETLVEKEEALKKEAEAPITNIGYPQNSQKQRTPRGAIDAHRMLDNPIRHLKACLQKRMTLPERVCCSIELYTLMCMQDCCSAIMKGESLNACAVALKEAVEALLKSTSPQIAPFVKKVESSHKDLQSARREKTMMSLNRAKSDNTLSEKKLETIKQIIG